MEPTPPAFETAAAISGVDTPAIGAWMIGNSIPSLQRNGSKAFLLLKWGYSSPARMEGERRQSLDASVSSDRSRLSSGDEIIPAGRGATVPCATQVRPSWRWSRLWVWIPGQAGPWPGLTIAAVEGC